MLFSSFLCTVPIDYSAAVFHFEAFWGYLPTVRRHLEHRKPIRVQSTTASQPQSAERASDKAIFYRLRSVRLPHVPCQHQS